MFRLKKILRLIVFSIVVGAALSAAADNQLSRQRNSGVDYSASVLGRTYPLSAAVVLDAGYNVPLWGDWHKHENVMYGYLRPSVNLASSLIVNVVEAKLTLKPISFLGLHVGRFIMARERYESADFDCGVVECQGNLDNQYLSADVTLAVGPVFYLGKTEYKDVKSLRGEKDFYEDIAAIIASRAKDHFVTSTHTVGYRFQGRADERLLGLNYRRTDAQNSRQFSENFGLVFGQNYREFRVLVVAGTYRSTIQKLGPAIGVSLDWLGGPQGLEL